MGWNTYRNSTEVKYTGKQYWGIFKYDFYRQEFIISRFVNNFIKKIFASKVSQAFYQSEPCETL